MSNVVLPSFYQNFIHLSRYSRWLYDKERRETWEETVNRYFTFFKKHLKERFNHDVSDEEIAEYKQAVLNLEVMPSMRALMTAGPALERDNMSGFNCSFVAIEDQKTFDEILYVLANGTGVGFSVESKYTEKLPEVAEEFVESDTIIVVADSKVGWARSLRQLISLLYSGEIPKWDVSKVRPSGAPLKVFGGRASGPGPLEDLFKFCIRVFKNAAGRKLSPIECHDIVCKIAEVIVVGGVRRSALISLSDLSDEKMRNAKSGSWWDHNVQRALANNSAVYEKKPDISLFLSEWKGLYDSKSGERGIFNIESARKNAPERRKGELIQGANPCCEILLRSKQVCNLSEVVIRAHDTKETMKRKVEIAAILGTWQSTLTNFRYLSKKWKDNCDEEMLLGVSLTGIVDNAFFGKPSLPLENELQTLRDIVVETNKKYASLLGVSQSTSTTCIKPSGTVSSLVDSASGIHARHSEYYIRNVRADNKDPLCNAMKELGFPNAPDWTKPESVSVFSFPVKSPKNSIFRNDMSAIDQLELWKCYKKNWAEHTVSITVSVKEHEWIEVAAWVYKNLEVISGISFLPHSDHIYKQAPFEECTEEYYKEMLKNFPKISHDKLNEVLKEYEVDDRTLSSQTLACSGSSCEVVDLIQT